MTMHDQVRQLEQRVATLRQNLDAARDETTEQIKARIEEVRANEAAGFQIVKNDAAGAASGTESKWATARADVAAKVRDVQHRIDRKRNEHDVKAADLRTRRDGSSSSNALRSAPGSSSGI